MKPNGKIKANAPWPGIISHGPNSSCLKSLITIIVFISSANTHFAQDANITGTITRASGTPLPNVHVLEKETMSISLSDFSGRFSVSTNKNLLWSLTFIIDKKSLRNTVKSAEEIIIKWSNAKPLSFKRLNIEEKNFFIILITYKDHEQKMKDPTTESQPKQSFFFIGNPAKIYI